MLYKKGKVESTLIKIKDVEQFFLKDDELHQDKKYDGLT